MYSINSEVESNTKKIRIPPAGTCGEWIQCTGQFSNNGTR